MVYAKGAYVNARTRLTTNDPTGLETFRDYADRDGWRAGAGIEQALSRHVYAKIEYDYSRYGRVSDQIGATEASLRLDRQQVLGGVGIRF